MNLKSSLILLISGIVIFVAGMGLGMLLKSGVVTKLSTTLSVTPQAIKDLSSRVIPSIAANGTVTAINGRSITLTSQGDTITVDIRSDAAVYSFNLNSSSLAKLKASGTATSSRQITFEDIKVGDTVAITLRLLPNGQLEGSSVIVLPPPLKPAAK